MGGASHGREQPRALARAEHRRPYGCSHGRGNGDGESLVAGAGGGHVKEAPLLFGLPLFHCLGVGKPSFGAPYEEDRLPFEPLCLVDRAQDDLFIVPAFLHHLFTADAADIPVVSLLPREHDVRSRRAL